MHKLRANNDFREVFVYFHSVAPHRDAYSKIEEKQKQRLRFFLSIVVHIDDCAFDAHCRHSIWVCVCVGPSTCRSSTTIYLFSCAYFTDVSFYKFIYLENLLRSTLIFFHRSEEKKRCLNNSQKQQLRMPNNGIPFSFYFNVLTMPSNFFPNTLLQRIVIYRIA